MRAPRAWAFWPAVLLAAAVLAVYGQVYDYGFVEFDDPGYVTENPFVRGGFTWDGVRWAFTTGHMWNWHPLTWLSHMLDVELFGLDPGKHHLTNVLLHLANALLLFALLQRTTEAAWPSLAVAALFALHPLHVESVAWISERKDVLSTLFFFLTLCGYVRFVEHRSSPWYLAALAFFALGLMTKQMLVTVPFVLLLLDVWPLGRLAATGSFTSTPVKIRKRRENRRREQRRQAAANTRPAWTGLVWEKFPFFILSILASTVAYLAQMWTGAMTDAASLPIGLRIGNALVAYVRYLWSAVWPTGLAVFYPYDMSLSPWLVAAAAMVLAAVSFVVLRIAPNHPYAIVGWLWYLGMLVPVIGLVQIGSQSHADRYTYTPLVGIFILIAWGARSLVARWDLPARVVSVAFTGMIAAYAAAAWMQVAVWRDGESLFAQAVRATRANYLAHNNLGAALAAQGKADAAIEQYREALRIKPDYAHARSNLAKALRGRYEHAVAVKPTDPIAHYNLATALADAGSLPEAIEEYRQALRLNPHNPDAHESLGNVLVAVDSLPEAIRHYEEALRLDPNDPTARFNLGSALARSGQLREAVEQYRKLVRLTPDDAEAWGNLAMAHGGLGQSSEALAAQRKTVELARQQRQWALVQTMEEWLDGQPFGLPGSGDGGQGSVPPSRSAERTKD